MFTIIRARKLAVLRGEAAQLPRLRSQVTEARYAAEAAVAEVARLSGELDAAIAAAGSRLGRLLNAVRDPVTGPSIQADIALRVVRDMIAEAKASGAADVIEGIRVIDALLGEDSAFSQPDDPAGPVINGRSARCVCPLPYCPGGPVPCEAAGQCMSQPAPAAQPWESTLRAGPSPQR